MKKSMFVMSLFLELRGFAPIGMLEGWNSGIMGSGKMQCWPPARRVAPTPRRG